MSLAKITLYGMYKYMQDHEDDLFDNLSVPTGMDAGKLIGRILYKGAEFGMLYGDPYFVQSLIGIWSETYEHTFERWVNALAIEYNPLENYNRTEEWQDAQTDNRSGSHTRSSVSAKQENEDVTRSDSSSTVDLHGGHAETTETGSNDTETDVRSASNSQETSSTENTVSAYDAATYQPANKADTDGSKQDTASTRTTTGGTASNTSESNDASRDESSRTGSSSDSTGRTGTERAEESGATSETGDRKAAHAGHLYGNIGVTTSQQMLKEEWEVAKLNIYDEAADLFLQEFCIYVY